MRRETWGTFTRQDGTTVTMIRGSHNRTWFEDDDGQIVSPVQSNIYPAMVWVYAETDWFDPTDVLGTVRCRDEVRAKVTYR